MRPLEATLVILIAGAAGSLLMDRWQRIGRYFSVCALVIALAHGYFEGAHWQMIPAYVASAILCQAAWKPEQRWRQYLRVTAVSALSLAALSLLFSFLLPMFRLPDPTGPYPVGTTILYFKDTARQEDAGPADGSARELMVQLWYPAQPSRNHLARYREPRETTLLSSYQSVLPTNSRLEALVANKGAAFPVILFNHAWRGRRTNDTFLTEELASHGYVVASIDHTYNARRVAFPDGRVIESNAQYDIDNMDSSTPERVKAIWNKELLKWVADQRFVLDRLEDLNRSAGSQWFGRLNINLAGAIGHSFGGAAATAACAADRRVRSAVNMNGSYFNAIRDRGPNQPLLNFGAASDQSTVPAAPAASGTSVEAILDEADFVDVMTSIRKYGGYLVSVKGAEHFDFTDQPLVSPLRMLSYSGTLPAGRVQNIVRTYVLAFFDKTLLGKDSGLLGGHSNPFAEASLEVWPASGSATVDLVYIEGK